MALDTAEKRISAMQPMSAAKWAIWPLPDSVLSTGDRALMAKLYYLELHVFFGTALVVLPPIELADPTDVAVSEGEVIPVHGEVTGLAEVCEIARSPGIEHQCLVRPPWDPEPLRRAPECPDSRGYCCL
jgi:hypothetical protein